MSFINARQRRREPGLRPQQVAGVQACAELCGATVEGVAAGSRTFEFVPGPHFAGGGFEWDIGTADSATLLALSVLPVACFAAAPVRARITGGLFQYCAPSPFHMHRVLAPLLRAMGAEVSLEVTRPGYMPGGGGIIEMHVVPRRQGLDALPLGAGGQVSDVHGIALSSHLAERRVSKGMASACEEQIRGAGMACAIDCVDDVNAVHARVSGDLGERQHGKLVRRRPQRTEEGAKERRHGAVMTVRAPSTTDAGPGDAHPGPRR